MENKQLKSFKDLTVWQKAADLASLIYLGTEKFPHSELYGLTNQMRRAAVSISSNLAEGFKRNHTKEKIQLYNVAHSSAAELESQIEIAYKLNFLKNEDYHKLNLSIVEVSKMIDGLIKSIKKTSLKSYILNSIFFILFLYPIFYLLNPLCAGASVLSFITSSREIYSGDTFLVGVMLDTESKEINAAEINIKFPKKLLEFVNFSKGDSVLVLWPQEPNYSESNEAVSFIGGAPNGFKGKGKILTLAFKALTKGVAEIYFTEPSKVLLNDGKGTEDALATTTFILGIDERKEGVSKNEWQEQIEKDKTPPEPFEIKISKDPSLFEGKYFISFFTTDSGSGIDYYEVKEGSRDWKKIHSPYLLGDQSLRSIIKVKAADKAGNERIAQIVPPKPPFLYWVIVLIFILVAAIVTRWVVKRHLLKPKNNSSAKK